MARMSTRRKLSIATWSAPAEGNIYGKMVVDAAPALAYIEHLRRQTGDKVTITHLVGRAVAEALKQTPTLNGRIFLGRFIPFDTVDVTFLVALEEGADLGKFKVERASEKGVAAIARELAEGAGRLRGGKDPDYEKSKGVIRALPTLVLRRLVSLTGWLTGAAGVELKALGLTRFPFGSCIVTSVGMFGVDEAFVPPTPFARVPLYVLVGAVREAPAVVDGKLAVQKQLTLGATIDHRFVDGFQIGSMARVVREVMKEPWRLDGHAAPPEGLGEGRT